MGGSAVLHCADAVMGDMANSAVEGCVASHGESMCVILRGEGGRLRGTERECVYMCVCVCEVGCVGGREGVCVYVCESVGGVTDLLA